jgi:RTA1 like protein
MGESRIKGLTWWKRYLIPLTIGPAFLTGSIYLCLARIVVATGTGISRLSPRQISLIFMLSDFFSLVLQGTGGGIASTANTTSGSNAGRYIMIAGLAWQVLSLAVYFALWAEFLFRARRTSEALKDPRFTRLRNSKKFKMFNYGKPFLVLVPY